MRNIFVAAITVGLIALTAAPAHAADTTMARAFGPQDLPDLEACLQSYDSLNVPYVDSLFEPTTRVLRVSDFLRQRADPSGAPLLYRGQRALWSFTQLGYGELGGSGQSQDAVNHITSCLERLGKVRYAAYPLITQRYFVRLNCSVASDGAFEDLTACVFTDGMNDIYPDAVTFSASISGGARGAFAYTFGLLIATGVMYAQVAGTPAPERAKFSTWLLEWVNFYGDAFGFTGQIATQAVALHLENVIAESGNLAKVTDLFGIETGVGGGLGGALSLTVDRLGEMYLSYAPTAAISVTKAFSWLNVGVSLVVISPASDAHWASDHDTLEGWVGGSGWSTCFSLLWVNACYLHSGRWFSDMLENSGTSYGITALPDTSIQVSWGPSIPLCSSRRDYTELKTSMACGCPDHSEPWKDLSDPSGRGDRCKCEAGYREVITEPGLDLYARMFTGGLSCEPDEPPPPYESPRPTRFSPASPPAPYTAGAPSRPSRPRYWYVPTSGGGSSGGISTGGGGTPSPAPIPKSIAKGDPHIWTRDEMTYTTLALGEFVYAHGSDGAVEVQARHQEIGGFAPWASFVTAAAVRAGGHVYEVGLPEQPGAPLALLMDGQPLVLPAGDYQIGGAQLRIDASHELTVAIEEPGLPASYAGQASAYTQVHIGRRVDTELVQPDPQHPLTALEVSMSTAPVGRYAGLLGVPDGDPGNELRRRDGAIATRVSPFVESWRITAASESLFTYRPGTSLATYNRVQDQLPPTPDVLRGSGGGRNFVAEITALIATQCGATVAATLEPTFVLQLAYDLAAGRPGSDFVAAGLCYDERLGTAAATWADVPQVAAALQLSGRVTRIGAPTQGVPGVSVVVRSATLGGPVCVTVTNDLGYYGCAHVFDPRAGTTLALGYEVSGRGPTLTLADIVTTPAPSTSLAVVHDFQVAPAAIVRLSGTVRTPAGAALPGAPVRITTPEYQEGVADALGRYAFELYLPDGVDAGTVHVEAASLDYQDSAAADLGFAGLNTGPVTLIRDLMLVVAQPPPRVPLEDPTTQPRRLAFTGRIASSSGGTTTGVLGAVVAVSAPGAITGGTCTATTGQNGQWSCTATLLVDQPFAAVVSVARLGTTAMTVAVASTDLPAPGGTRGKAVGDMIVTPTVLRTAGRVTVSGQGRAGAKVTIAVSNLATEVTTDATGGYVANLDIYDDLAATAPVTYRAVLTSGYGNDVTETIVPLGAVTPGAVNPRTVDLAFTRRRYRFAGAVRNQLVSGTMVPGAYVRIFRDGGTVPSCGAVADSAGLYSCEVVVEGSAAWVATYQVSGYGRLTVPGINVEPSGPPTGPPQLVARDLTVSPTTLVVAGRVRRPGGASVANASVEIGPVPSSSVSRMNVTTGADGGYRYAFPIHNDNVSTTSAFEVVATDDIVQRTETLTTPLSAGALTSLDHDLELAAVTPISSRWDVGIQGLTLAANDSGVTLGPDGTLYALASGVTNNRWAFTLTAIAPTTHAVRTATVTVPLASSGQRAAPVLGAGPSGEALIYVTSDGNQDGELNQYGYRENRAYIYAFRATDLTLYRSWAAPIDQSRVSPATAVSAEGVVYVVTKDRNNRATLHALTAGLGTATSNPLTGTSYYSNCPTPVIGSDGTVYVANERGVQAFASAASATPLDARWGQPASCDPNILTYELAIGRDAAGSDVVYAHATGSNGDSPQDFLCAFAAADGARRWKAPDWPTQFQVDLDPTSAPVIGLDGTLYVLSDHHRAGMRLVGLDPATGQQRGSPIELPFSGVSTPLLGADGTLYFTGDDALLAVQPATGATGFYAPPLTRFEGWSYALATDGALYVTVKTYTTSGYATVRLHAFDVAAGGLAATPWPKSAGGSANAGRP